MKHLNLCLFLILCLTVPTYAQQNTPILSKTVHLNEEQRSIREILRLITQQTGAQFSYNPQIIDVQQKATIYSQHKPLSDVLEQLLSPAITFSVYGNYIILNRLGFNDTNTPPNEVLSEDVNSPDVLQTQETQHIPPVKKREYNPYFNKIAALSNTGDLNVRQYSPVFDIHNDKPDFYSFFTQKNLAQAVNEATNQKDKDKEEEAKQKKVKNKPLRGVEAPVKKTFHAGFIYPLGTDLSDSKITGYNFSFNLLGGVTGGTSGFEMASLFNINRYTTSAFQLAGLFNTAETLNGFQLAGLFNKSVYSNPSAQVAGIINYAGEGESVAQISAITNIADESKFQFATVNIARESKFQIGIVNISDSANVMIGLINLAKNGFIELEVSSSELIHGSVAFRSGLDKFYGIFSLGYHFKNNTQFIAWGIGFGTTLISRNKWGLGMEATHFNLAQKNFNQDGYSGLIQLKPVFQRKIGEHVRLFIGPTANFLIKDVNDGINIDMYSLWKKESDKLYQFWIGGSLGLRIRF